MGDSAVSAARQLDWDGFVRSRRAEPELYMAVEARRAHRAIVQQRSDVPGADARIFRTGNRLDEEPSLRADWRRATPV
jgi:hypothetical protein